MVRQTKGRRDGRKDGWMYGRPDGGMDGWIEGCIDGCHKAFLCQLLFDDLQANWYTFVRQWQFHNSSHFWQLELCFLGSLFIYLYFAETSLGRGKHLVFPKSVKHFISCTAIYFFSPVKIYRCLYLLRHEWYFLRAALRDLRAGILKFCAVALHCPQLCHQYQRPHETGN